VRNEVSQMLWQEVATHTAAPHFSIALTAGRSPS